MRYTKPSCFSVVAAAFSRAGHFVSEMLETDLFPFACVGDAPICCADPVGTMLGADARPWNTRSLAAWVFAKPSDSTVHTAIATFFDSI